MLNVLSKKRDHVAYPLSGRVSMEEEYREFMEAKQANRLSTKTLKNYHYTIGRFVEWLGGRKLTQKAIYQYFAQLDYDNPETVATHARGVRCFLRFHSLKFDVPMPSLRRQERLTQDSDNVNKALSVCTSDRDRALIMFLFSSGCRRGETANLKWKHINLETGIVQIPNGKTGARMTIIGSKAREALREYRNGQGEEDSVFGISGGGIRQAINRIGAKSGVKLTAQSFRRGFASECIRNGMGLIHLQSLMGHANITTTRRYVTVREADLIEAHKEYGPMELPRFGGQLRAI